MSIFAPADTPCGIFAPSLCADGAQYVLSFVRATALLQGRPPAQTVAGEVTLSFTPIGTLQMEMQPKALPLARLLNGIVVEVAWTGYTTVAADVKVLDRCYFQGRQLEVVNVLPWGDHKEIEYRYLGR